MDIEDLEFNVEPTLLHPTTNHLVGQNGLSSGVVFIFKGGINCELVKIDIDIGGVLMFGVVLMRGFNVLHFYLGSDILRFINY